MTLLRLIKTSSFLVLAFFCFCRAEAASVWSRRWDSVDELVMVLQAVPSGKAVWQEALRRDPALAGKMRRARSSFTESTYIRNFRVDDASGTVSFRHEVYLGDDLSLAEAVLDLSHELHHYLHRRLANPYDPKLEPEDFVRNGIEGPGGELEAFETECRVAWELTVRYDGFPDHPLCGRYRVGESGFHRDRARRDFYAVGSAWRELKGKLIDPGGLPLLSGREVVFRSGHAGVAYPLALTREFTDTVTAACRNNERKARMIAAHGGRAPSAKKPALMEEQRRILDFQRYRCGSRR